MSGTIYLLDTNTVTYIATGRSVAARAQLEQTSRHSTILVSTVTQGEILCGFEKNPSAVRLLAAVKALFDAVQIVSWDPAAAHAYSKLRAGMAATGKSLSAMDMLIAAHAFALGAVLVTHDRAFLHAAPMLDVEDWATDL